MFSRSALAGIALAGLFVLACPASAAPLLQVGAAGNCMTEDSGNYFAVRRGGIWRYSGSLNLTCSINSVAAPISSIASAIGYVHSGSRPKARLCYAATLGTQDDVYCGQWVVAPYLYPPNQAYALTVYPPAGIFGSGYLAYLEVTLYSNTYFWGYRVNSNVLPQ